MPLFIVPKNVGKCFVARGPTGLFTVYNNRSGKERVCIPCNSQREAERICERLNTGDHPGEIPIPNAH